MASECWCDVAFFLNGLSPPKIAFSRISHCVQLMTAMATTTLATHIQDTKRSILFLARLTLNLRYSSIALADESVSFTNTNDLFSLAIPCEDSPNCTPSAKHAAMTRLPNAHCLARH